MPGHNEVFRVYSMSTQNRAGSRSPTRSSQSSTVSHLLASSLNKGMKNMTPITPKDLASMAAPSNVMTVVVDSVKVKTSEVQMGTNALYLKICSGKDSRTLLQKGQTVKEGYSIYSIDEHALFVPGSAKKVHLAVEIFMASDKSVAKGSITFDADTLLKNSGTEGGQWENIVLKAKVDATNKNLKLMHIVGEVKVNVEMKPEAYWSDSESDNSTATNSVSTTPGSVVSTHASKLISYLHGSNSSSKSMTATPKGSATKVTFTSPKSVSSVSEKENSGTASNVKPAQGDNDADKKGSSVVKPSPGTGVLKSALKQSSNSSTFSYSKVNNASASKSMSLAPRAASRTTPSTEKKEITLSAKSPTPEKAKKSEMFKMAGGHAMSMDMVQLMMAGIVGLAFLVSLLLRPYLAASSSHLHLPSPMRNWSGTQMVIYNPSKRVLLVDEHDGACMAWRRGVFGGHAAFSTKACSSSLAFWSLRQATHASFLQLEHANGKCLCPKSEFGTSSALAMKACDTCSSGWSLDSSGKLQGGKAGAAISRKANGVLNKGQALLAKFGTTAKLVAFSSEEKNTPLKKFLSF